MLGEVYFTEALSPDAPRMQAVEVASHDPFTFYNPIHHPFFDSPDGRTIYFEGTFTTTFSAAPAPIPRYDYNQLMYSLNLADIPFPRRRRDDGKDGEVLPSPAELEKGSDMTGLLVPSTGRRWVWPGAESSAGRLSLPPKKPRPRTLWGIRSLSQPTCATLHQAATLSKYRFLLRFWTDRRAIFAIALPGVQSWALHLLPSM